ncbi:hypothetical protein H0O00_04965 [Candidatus Micrarchaeota archaeon]|nr:hypothetical protein [Candidatus Micrarchaeota archaeon]
MIDASGPKKPKSISVFPVVPYSGMAEMRDIPRQDHWDLSRYTSQKIGAHPSISDAVTLVLLNQILSIPGNPYSGNGAAVRQQHDFSRDQLRELMNSMRVFEIFFDYRAFGLKNGRTGSFRAKTVVQPSSYPDLQGQVVKVPSEGFDLVFLSYWQSSIPDRDSLKRELFADLGEGKYKEEMDAGDAALRPPLLPLSETRLLNILMLELEKPNDKIESASALLATLAARYEEESEAEPALKKSTLAKLKATRDLVARIESEADSMLALLPSGPKEFVESIAKHVVGKRGALIVWSDACDTSLDPFRTIKSFGDGSVVLYQRND